MRVLLVDDEIFTIRMLQSVIRWKELGLELAGYAQDGEEAYQKVLQEKPDIVISDIRMPGMDGLEFLRRAYAVLPELKTILMSAYADFSYVKEGLKLGCSDYILKPIDETELERALRKVIFTIQGEKEHEQVIAQSVKQLESMKLYRYMRSGHGKNNVLRLWQEAAMREYCVFQIQVNNTTMDEYSSFANVELGHEGYYLGLLERITGEYTAQAYVFDYEENCWTVILGMPGEMRREQAAQKIAARMKEETGISYTVCFSVPGNSLEELPKLYEEVRDLSKYRFYVGDEEILGYGYNCSRQELAQVCTIGQRKETTDSVSAAGAYSRPVKESMQMIENRYNQNLSLDDICAQVLVSKNYFCYLFKRELGMSVWNYLTVIRLQQAKKLLEETDLRSYEIAFQVGYDNPSYFSKIFKKYENMTPNEYRESRKGRK